jgi:hypothetical protein
MKKIGLPLVSLLIASTFAFSQQGMQSRLKVFIDCPGGWCDMQFIRSEINIVDFLHINNAADVHVLITAQNTGSGGDQYQLIFFGQHYFKNQQDTLRFATQPNTTEFEKRDQLLKFIKTGLVPFIAKTSAVINMQINLKAGDTILQGSSGYARTKDPWNAWVFRMGGDVNFNTDANYNNTNYNTNFSVNRITDKSKIGLGFYLNRNRSAFEYEDSGIMKKLIVSNHSWSVNQYFVKTVNKHWSLAYEIKYNQNTFSNNKGRAFLRIAGEYNIFPFKDANNKLLTLSYGLTGRMNSYYDTTIFNENRENLYGHRATAYLSLNQKWGNTSAGITYQNYFRDWKLFNLGMDIYINVRITGGLSFYLLAFGGLTRDQVFLVKGDATPEVVLTRRRQLASGYNVYTSFGISYQFGSKLNNVVNPRFDRSSASSED